MDLLSLWARILHAGNFPLRRVPRRAGRRSGSPHVGLVDVWIVQHETQTLEDTDRT